MTELMRRRRVLMAVGGGSSPYQHGTWDDLFWHIDNGTYATAYSVGEVLPLDLGTEGSVGAQIAAFDADEKANGSGFAAVTFISKYLLATSKRFDSSLNNPNWSTCELRGYIQSTIAPLIPSAVSGRIAPVIKYTRTYDSYATMTQNTETTDSVWIPSAHEVFNNYESEGPFYKDLFGTASASVASTLRVKSKSNASGITWVLRTGSGTNRYRSVSSAGSAGNEALTTPGGIAIGFCID